MDRYLLKKIDTFRLEDSHNYDLVWVIDEALICARRRYEEYGIAKIDHVVLTNIKSIKDNTVTYWFEAWGTPYE